MNAPTSDEYVKFEVRNDIVKKTLMNKAASPSRSSFGSVPGGKSDKRVRS